MVLGTNSENQQVNTSLPVRYEELKGSIHEELEQKRKLKFEPKVQVKDIPSTGKRRACKDARKFTKIEKQLRQANTGQKDLYFKLLKAFEGEDLVSAKELVREMKNLNISYRVQGVKLLLLLRLFVTNACKDAGWFEFYKDVLSEGGKIDLNADVCSSGTALSYACREKNKDVAELLLKHGTDINKVSALSGKTPILIALKNNDHNLASLLFRYGAKIDVTPELEQAIIADSYSEYEKETMGILLQHTSPEQNTEMLKHFSSNVTLESTEIVKLLLDKGADPNIGEPDAMQIATDKGNIELMNLFNQKLGRESKSLEDSFVIIPDNLTLNKIQDILDKAANENDDAKLTEVVNNIQDYESQVICNFDDPEEAGLFVGFSKKVLNLQSQVRDQYVLSRILMVLQSQENGSRYSVKELLLLAIAANDELTKKYHDMLFAKGNLNLLHLLVGGEKYIETFIGKFPDLYQSLKNQAIRLENGEVGFFSVIVLREEQELLDKVFANEDTLQNLKEILKNNTSDPTYGVLEAASLVQNEEFIKKVLDVFERDAKQNINDPATKTLLKESCITLLEAAISQECFPIVEYLCKKCIEGKNEAIQTIYKEAFTDDKIIETLKKQILKSIGTRGRREIYDLMLKTASSADNIIFLGKVLNLVKGNTKPFRESFATISENASPTTVEQLQKYKDMTKFTEVPRDVEPREEIQKALEKCLESRIPHKYSEFEAIESRDIKASSRGWFAMRKGVDFFIKPLNVDNDDSVRSFITEVIAGPLYRLALFGKSPKIWLIEDDQDQIFLGSEFLPNFNAFNHLYIEARDKSNIKQEKYSDEAQHKFKEELQKSVENSKYFAKFLAACLIFREFDFHLGNFGMTETNDTGIAERKWAKIDHGLSFEYQRFDQECSSSDCLGILKFYLQERKQHGHPAVDGLLKEVLAELVDDGKLSEELGNMCKFLEESKALIEQLIDKQVGDLNKALSAHHGIKFSILNETFSYNAKHRVFVTDQGDELSKYFKEILYDQVKKAKEFSEELSKKNKDLKMEDLSLGCNSLDNTTGSNAQGDSSKAHSEVIVTESNSSDGENKKTVASSIRFQGHTSQDRKENLDITGQNALQLEQEEPSQQAKTDDLIQEKIN
ncbi:ankyrin repeat domain-containing protein [Wolbachia endosymbiont (group A) of Nomada goodeniana]|uniref:host RNA manipulator TomO n=1 Tax=Wolbachia endosymbiont (group A) of Nomada goodeniana TaxID=3066207 RepID=UPI003341DB49